MDEFSMKDLFEQYDLNLNDKEIALFEKFLEIFIKVNSEINLSSIREREEIIEKHFIDSLLIHKILLPEGNVLDIGTGGGFPGIPLSIVDDKADFLLIDSIGKKINIVNEFIKELGLKNIKGLQARAEELGQNDEYRNKFDIVISRATAYMPTLLEYSIPFLKIGGIFIAYKLDNNLEIEESKKAFLELKCELIKKESYILAGQERVYLFIQKTGETPKKYPRHIGEPLKKPIK